MRVVKGTKIHTSHNLQSQRAVDGIQSRWPLQLRNPGLNTHQLWPHTRPSCSTKPWRRNAASLTHETRGQGLLCVPDKQHEPVTGSSAPRCCRMSLKVKYLHSQILALQFAESTPRHKNTSNRFFTLCSRDEVSEELNVSTGPHQTDVI